MLGIILIIGALFFLVFWVGGSIEKERTENKNQWDEWFESQNITISSDYVYDEIRFVVDNINKMVYIPKNWPKYYYLSFREIIGCEILVNSQVTGGVGRSIAGGVIGGTVGAIVGASTAKEKVDSYQVVIYRNTIENPQITLDLISGVHSKDSATYHAAQRFATHINASIKAIISNNNR